MEPMTQAIAIADIPNVTSGADLAAVIAPHLNVAVWPDGHVGLRGDDLVAIAGKLLAKSQGRWHPRGAAPDGFRTRDGIPDKLGLKAPLGANTAAAELRKGLAARFGGRPGVLITGSGPAPEGGASVGLALGAAGLDLERDGLAVVDALAAYAGLLMELHGSPVVVIRDLPGIFTWED